MLGYMKCIFTTFVNTLKELNDDATNILDAYGGFLENLNYHLIPV